MLDLLHRLPGLGSRVFDRRQLWLGVAIRHHVEPVTIAAGLWNFVFVRSEEHGALPRADALDFDEPQLTAPRVETLEVVTEVLFVYVYDDTAGVVLVLHGDPHANLLGLLVRPKLPHFRSVRLRIGKH